MFRRKTVTSAQERLLLLNPEDLATAALFYRFLVFQIQVLCLRAWSWCLYYSCRDADGFG